MSSFYGSNMFLSINKKKKEDFMTEADYISKGVFTVQIYKFDMKHLETN